MEEEPYPAGRVVAMTQPKTDYDWRIYGKRTRMKARQEAISEYGGRCVCCGETESEFLTIDHIDGQHTEGFYKLRRNYRKGRKQEPASGHVLYAWLRRQGFPKGVYQLLCWNCNSAKGTWGMC